MDYLRIVNQILSFILILYGDPNLPRNIVQNVIIFVKDFIKNTLLSALKNDILNILKNENITAQSLYKINECFENYGHFFDSLDTEYKRFSVLKKRGFLDVEKFPIGKTFEKTIVDNKSVFIPVSMFGYQIPLRESLRLFLEIPGMFTGILDYMKKISQETNIISNIIQSKLWKTFYQPQFVDETVLPLYIFFDDLEVGNVLGSHNGSNKFGIIYASIASLPPRIASRLNSILFSTIFYSEDKKKSNNETVFKSLIDELNYLRENGILIKIDNVTKRVKFQLILILGDNLGLNGICGFVESFKAKFCCRICRTSSDDYEKYVNHNCNLRNAKNYEEDIRLKDVSKTGIKEACVFNNVKGFNIINNFTVDIMHDLLEGVCVYVLRAILFYFIFKKEYFTLQTLNDRINNFDFGTENTNKPPLIKVKQGKEKLNMKFSAAEMLCLVRYLGLIIGDLVPKTDKNWSLYINLRHLIDIVMSPQIVESDAKDLDKIVKNLNSSYFELSGKLKPKFHFLTHYCQILLSNGPLIKFWSMRFESFHRSIKSTAESTASKVNVIKTVAIKQSLKLCEMIHSLTFENSIKFGSVGEKQNKSFFEDKEKNEKYECFEEIEIDGIDYKVGSFLVVNIEKSEVEFGEIENIIYVDNEIYFYFKIFEEIIYDNHVQAYLVKSTENKLIGYVDLPYMDSVQSIVKKDFHFIVTKHRL